MTIQPNGPELTGLDPSGMRNYGTPGAIEDIPDTISFAGGNTPDSPSIKSTDLRTRSYGQGQAPVPISVDLWGKNGYYMNGPNIGPMNDATSLQNRINASSKSWSDMSKQYTMDYFADLLTTYGHTNSAGVLWGIASNNLDLSNSAVKGLLGVDSSNKNVEDSSSAPAKASSPAAQDDSSWFETAISPIQTGLRNTLSAFMYPLEMIQGSISSIGGAITDDSKPWDERLGDVALGVLGGPGSLQDALMNPDSSTPIAQTTLGQTFAYGAQTGNWVDAFTSAQADLDIQRARDELLQDPANKDLDKTEQGIKQLDLKAEQLAMEKGYYGDTGWFIGETSPVGNAQRQASYNSWAIPAGSEGEMVAWTMGRGIASKVFDYDTTAYNVLSGTVDAVAAIALDPLTYLGGIGLGSQGLKAVGRGIENIGRGSRFVGMETKLTVGKALRNEVKAYSSSYRQLEKAYLAKKFPEWEKARQSYSLAFSEQYGRLPTREELIKGVGNPPVYDPADVARMSIEDKIDLIKQSRAADITTEQMALAKPDLPYVVKASRALRRTVGRNAKLANISAKEMIATDSAESLVARELWQKYLDYSYVDADGKMQFFRGGLRRFNAEVLGYDEATKQFANPETFRLFNSLLARRDELVSSGLLKKGRIKHDTDTSFLERIGQKTYSVKRPKDIDVDQVARDTAAIYARTTIADDIETLATSPHAGAVSMEPPRIGVPVIGVMDDGPMNKVESIIYWTGKKEPVIVNAEDLIPDETRRAVARKIMEVLDSPEMKTIGYDGEVDSVMGQVAAAIARAADVKETSKAVLASTGLTWGDLLKFASTHGLDEHLDDILRTLKKGKVDGITGTSGIANKGTWMGHHPNSLTYRVNQGARDSGMSVKGATDVDTALEGLDIPVEDLISIGLRNGTSEDIAVALATGTKRIDEQAASLQDYNASRMAAARLRQDTLQQRLDQLEAMFADKPAALRRTLQAFAGLSGTAAGGKGVDPNLVRNFLFGLNPFSFFANKALRSMADFVPEATRAELKGMEKSSKEYKAFVDKAMGDLYIVTKGKWDSVTYRAVAENAINGGGVDGLLTVLGPRLGIDVGAGSIARTTAKQAGDKPTMIKTMRTGNSVLNRALSQMPTARKVNLQDPGEVADAILLYGNYARVAQDELSKRIGNVLNSEGTMSSVGVNRNMLKEVFDLASDSLVDQLDRKARQSGLYKGAKGAARLGELKRAIHSSTRIWIGGEVDGLKESIARYATDSNVPFYTTSTGRNIEIPTVMIDTELAMGFVGLPSVDEWNSAINRVFTSIGRFKTSQNTFEFAKRAYDNIFRTSLLAFRISYILRNTAEMQIRMFLNGHKSIISDPATMIAMTIGNNRVAKKAAKYEVKKRDAYQEFVNKNNRVPDAQELESIVGRNPREKFLASLIPYENTILDTAFEVGMDTQLAVANFVEDYNALIRHAHSLTDPRVYNNVVRQGWTTVNYGQPAFFDGWAHELIMLQRSLIVQKLLAPMDRNASTIVNVGDNLSDEDLLVDWLMRSGDPEATEIRDLFIGANPKYEEVFNDPKATREWLFDSEFSVRNRIVAFTNNDPQILGFLRTGELRTSPSETINLRVVADPSKRLSLLSGALKKDFDNPGWESWFRTKGVAVPWIEKIDQRPGFKLFNAFFDLSNKFERLGAVGPEYRMSYWDKIAELAPALRASDVGKAAEAARTTLSPIKRMSKTGKLDDVGKNHPAFEALNRAQKENSDGLLTLEEIHSIASTYAAESVREIFYDAARRNNTWNALRLIFPFGQAWGNTVNTWFDLGKKNPIQIYKAYKALNALTEEGSSTIYDVMESIPGDWAMNDYEPGMAPWEQSSDSGFFYQDSYGQTSFMYPFMGRLSAIPLNIWGKMTGTYTPNSVPTQSSATSLNFAFGSESPAPGVSIFGSLPITAGLIPNDEINSQLRQIVSPYQDKSVLESAFPAWFSKMIGGVGAVPVIGDMLDSAVDGLSPMNKYKNVRDAMAILASSGNYANYLTDETVQLRLQQDAQKLAKALLFTTGFAQNLLPTTPYPQIAIDLPENAFNPNQSEQNVQMYTIGVLNNYYQQYRVRNGYDDTAAREEFVRDFGPAALFATVGEWKGLGSQPTSQAMDFQQQHPDIAAALPDDFVLFFPQGDFSDVEATAWAKKYGSENRERRSGLELMDVVTQFTERVQRHRIQSMYANDIINEAEMDSALDELKDRYIGTRSSEGSYIDKGNEMNHLKYVVDKYQPIRDSQAGQAFTQAWALRQAVLDKVRSQTGDESSGLGSDAAAPVLEWYVARINELEANNPDFVLLASKFRREWE